MRFLIIAHTTKTVCLGASVDAFKKGDWTPLMIASTSSKIQAAKIVHILLRHRANPELKNKDGWTAMHLACKAGNIDVVMQLASAKSSLLTEPSRSGRISLHIAGMFHWSNNHSYPKKCVLHIYL
jgi:ankyrin repeat protein